MHSPILLAALLTALCLQPTTAIPSPFTPPRNIFSYKLLFRQKDLHFVTIRKRTEYF